MRITLPERITGARDALFVLEIEFPSAAAERKIEVVTRGPVEALDLRGTGPGGRYLVPPGLERIHVPLRVTADGAGEAEVQVRCIQGPDTGSGESRTVRLEQAPSSAAGKSGRLVTAGLALAALVAVGLLFGPKLFGKSEKVMNLVGKDERAAVDA